jgi:glycosyltransferase involved in cell wall biosynthesis
MKILLVTYDNPFEALTGVATYVRGLSEGLIQRGWEVSHTYRSFRSWCLRPCLKWSDRDGRVVARVVTPSLLPQGVIENPIRDVRHPVLERLFEEVLLRIRPDLVHLHDLSGIPAAFVLAAKRHQFPVVITSHDFWPFCRQLLLLRPSLIPCEGSEGGRNCALFCSARPLVARRLLHLLSAMVPSPRIHDGLRRSIRLYCRLRGRASSQFVVPPSPHFPRLKAPRVEKVYRERESLMREALLSADILLTVSKFAKSKFMRHGYPANRIRVVPLSSQFTDRVPWRLRTFQGYPVRFGYLGRVTPWKGAHIIAEAVRGIPADRAQFTFYGAVEEQDLRFLVNLSGSHQSFYFRGRYTHDGLQGILDEIDVLIYPSVMSELQGLVGLEAQAAGLPIIGAERGGIAECVQHEVNGLLFSAGSASSLRDQVLRIINDPDLIARLSANVVRPRPMHEHISEIERVYAEALGAIVMQGHDLEKTSLGSICDARTSER